MQATDITVTRTTLWDLASLPSFGFGEMSVGLQRPPETTILGEANSKGWFWEESLSFNKYADIHQQRRKLHPNASKG